ncbi:glucose dehydrogenase [FAD, quinone] [Orussus abietinus]|uniref:glucose dehydrogenase [FAD, quinone] n=1 Tax=Orussus abietinus TaxID=222816 RepID=UPI0006261DF6|nr:glucose dehydrogenase [FAD, quinone] [Orussus abietinus]
MGRLAWLSISLAVLLASADGQWLQQYLPDMETISIIGDLASMTSGMMDFLQQGQEYQTKEPADATPLPFSEYDFVIVGAGSAGAALAGRLSEIPDATVLLVEAGRGESLIMDVPLLVNYLQLNSEINWKYQSEPSDRYCLGMTNYSCQWPRGKVMGGSSVLNYMIASRGTSEDYDRWAKMGNKGWAYEDVLPYFRKLEDIEIEELKKDSRHHGVGGPQKVSSVPYRTPLATAFVEAGRELGYRTIDYNAEELGFSFLQTTLHRGTRMSSSTAYLHPARDRPNLVVSKRSLVTKVLIDPEKKEAYGVEFVKDRVKFVATARKEVILCAGAIGSAQLLMLSGVGPAAHLKEHGIPVLVDAPVGENLMDHIAFGGTIFTVDEPVALLATDIVNPANPYIREYLTRRDGPITIPGGCEALAFVNLGSPSSRGHADIELLFASGSIVSDPAFRYTLGLSDELWYKTYYEIEGKYSWCIFPLLMKPKSRGRLLLRDGDVNSKPRLYANYMDHPEDVKTLVTGIRASIAVAETKAMRKFGSKIHATPVAGCEGHPFDSDAYWECAVRTFPFTIYHYSGTCKMAPPEDPSAVVDPSLRVIGIKRLRVADASIMPEIVTGHTSLPCIMIAEKLADMLKDTWGYPR